MDDDKLDRSALRRESDNARRLRVPIKVLAITAAAFAALALARASVRPVHISTVVIATPAHSGPALASSCEPTAATDSPPALVTEPAAPVAPMPKVRAIGERFQATAPSGPMLGLAVSRHDRQSIAAWSARATVVSRDGGRTFSTIPELQSRRVVAAALDRGGMAYFIAPTAPKSDEAQAGFELVAVNRKGVAKVSPLEGIGSVADFQIAAGHLIIYAYGNQADDDYSLRVSSDRGRTWQQRTVPSGNSENKMLADNDGTIWLLTGSEAGCGGGGQSRYRSSLTDSEWHAVPWPLDVPVGTIFGPKGWMYGVTSECRADDEGVGLCGVGRTERVVLSLGLEKDSDSAESASNGRIALALLDATLVKLHRGKAEVLDTQAPKFDTFAVDRAGRLVGISNGYIVRRERSSWRSLFPSTSGVAVSPKAGAP